jgi:DNA polymerase III alpha subunit
METEPLWDLLQDDSFTSLLFHINGYGDLLRKQKPTSILELAVCLALIRPGKRHLQDMTKKDIMEQIWEKPTTGEYHFKKSHAVAYATAIVVQMNQICESISYGYS